MRLAILLIALLFSATTHAGEEMEKFRQDIQQYLSAQKKSPNKIIKYKDKYGSISKRLLNPERIELIHAESISELDGIDNLKAILDEFKPVAQNYERAFAQLHGQYDLEHLDSFELLFRFIIVSSKPIKNIKAPNQDPSLAPILEALQKMTAALPTLLTGALEREIKNGAFGSDYEDQAKTRLAKLKAMAMDAK